MTETKGYGQLNSSGAASQFKALEFIVQQMIARTRTMQVVKVLKVTNAGGVEAVGFVDVQVMVNQVDGHGNSVEHGVIYNVPYTRVQGGRNAVIIDPVVNDIGWMAVADRDISGVKEQKATTTPGSSRRYDLADGVYLGGILNDTPTQYVRFFENTIEVVAEELFRIEAPETEVEGNASISGDLHVGGDAFVEGDTELDGDLLVTGSATIDGNADIGGDLAVDGNALIDGSLNIDGPLSIGTGATITRITSGSITIVAVPALAQGGSVFYQGTCSGAQVGDAIAVSHAGLPGAAIYNVYVSAANTVRVFIFNPFAVAVAIPGETMNVVCFGVT